jgi:hypothetical protein
MLTTSLIWLMQHKKKSVTLTYESTLLTNLSSFRCVLSKEMTKEFLTRSNPDTTSGTVSCREFGIGLVVNEWDANSKHSSN